MHKQHGFETFFYMKKKIFFSSCETKLLQPQTTQPNLSIKDMHRGAVCVPYMSGFRKGGCQVFTF